MRETGFEPANACATGPSTQCSTVLNMNALYEGVTYRICVRIDSYAGRIVLHSLAFGRFENSHNLGLCWPCGPVLEIFSNRPALC